MKQKEGPGDLSVERLRALPQSPGVYLMKDSADEVIYVGKAKNLKARVMSYFSGSDSRINVAYLMDRIAHVETLVTADERQAILLEADLIKRYKPRYNIRLKDDRSYLLVRIDMNQEWPRLELVREVKEDGARYIGPFAFGYELRAVLEVIKRSIPLRTCSDKVLHNRVRPCLEYQIKRCSGPCCLPVDFHQYREWVQQAMQILQGSSAEVIEHLQAEMMQASESLRFEDAALIRDRIGVLQQVQQDRSQFHFGLGAIDAFGVYREGELLEVSILMVRNGRLLEAKTFGFSDVLTATEEVLGSLLTQFYSGGSVIPERILIPFVLEDAEAREALLRDRANAAVKLKVPSRGSNFRLLELAKQNAKENFEARFSTLDKADRILRALQVELKLESIPRTIHCVDVSHFQGGSTVAAVVVFRDAKPDRKSYRHFHLTQEGKPDDFASMREVILRHLSRGMEELTLPDLLVVDGGSAQLSKALEVRQELGLREPAIVGLAKKRGRRESFHAFQGAEVFSPSAKPERVYFEGSSVPSILPPKSEATHLLERIRDEAHRVAVGFHRKTRQGRTMRSRLDGIPGVGPSRRQRLLREFKSIRAISEASPEDLNARCGIPLSLAQRIQQSLGKKTE